MDLKCLYGYGCDTSTTISGENSQAYLKYPVNDLRVFEKNYCDISYADGYLLVGEESGQKGKIKYFISNGIGNWREKIFKIQNKLNDYDIAYFVVPEAGSLIVVTKTSDMPIVTASRVFDTANEIASSVASSVAKSQINKFVDEVKKGIKVDVSFVATANNKVYELEHKNLSAISDNDVIISTYKVPDELKCGDYQVKVTLSEET